MLWEFPGSLVVRILCFHCRGLGLIPGWGTEIPQAVQCGQRKKKNAAVNIGCIYLFKLVFSFSLDVYPGVELLDHMVVLVLVTEIFKAMNVI